MIIELPYPHKDLMPNRANGKHWGQTSKLKAETKLAAFLITKSALLACPIELGESIPLTITFVQADRRRRDRDNLLAASKHALDGVAQALNIDDYKFNPITIKRAYDPSGSYMMVEI